jgi:putative nucleotidyltransferase with HDIG domain
MKKEEILYTIKGLPPFPETALKAIKVIKDSDSSAQDLVNIIQYDQSITANILRFANSAYFGLRAKVTSLKQAVAYLGTKAIMDMLFLSGSLSYFRGEYTGYGLKGEDLLSHSVSTALMCRILGERIELEETSTVFTAGLLHDIGKVVLSSFVRDKYNEIMQLVTHKKYSFVMAEREVLGMDHAQVGGEMAQQWGIPASIASPISLHHQFEKAPIEDISTPLVFLADQAYFLIGGTMGADTWSFRKIKEALTRCRLREDDLDSAMLALHESMKSVQGLLRP